VGLGEAFADGLWGADDLVGLLTLGANERSRLDLDGRWLSIAATARMRVQEFARRPRMPEASARNVEAHYDHGNEFYRLWLDESMTYSCAFFASEDDTIEQAQRNKHLMLAEKAGLCSEHKVLDLGCGWGVYATGSRRVRV
jgi:cyclopropane-fatty-acyl-phospholipid synthase